MYHITRTDRSRARFIYIIHIHHRLHKKKWLNHPFTEILPSRWVSHLSIVCTDGDWNEQIGEVYIHHRLFRNSARCRWSKTDFTGLLSTCCNWITLVRNGFKRITLVRNGFKWITLVRNGLKWITLVRNGLKWITLVRNGFKRITLVRNGLKWITLVRNGFKRITLVRNTNTERHLRRTLATAFEVTTLGPNWCGQSGAETVDTGTETVSTPTQLQRRVGQCTPHGPADVDGQGKCAWLSGRSMKRVYYSTISQHLEGSELSKGKKTHNNWIYSRQRAYRSQVFGAPATFSHCLPQAPRSLQRALKMHSNEGWFYSSTVSCAAEDRSLVHHYPFILWLVQHGRNN